MIISLNDYRHLFDGQDATLAVQEALLECKKHPNCTLQLGGGELHFYPKYAFEKEYYVSNNDYSKKSIAFPLIDMADFVVDGQGADLIFHGAVLPFVVDHSRNITIRGLSVDYAHPCFFQGTITAEGEDFLELDYDPASMTLEAEEEALTLSCAEENWSFRMDRLLVCEFEKDTGAPSAYIPPYFTYFRNESDGSFLSVMYRYLTPSLLEPGKLRLTGRTGHRHNVGNLLIGTFGGRYYPGILATCSKDLLIQDVVLYHTAAMGVIGQLCENVTMERLEAKVRPGSGRYLSVNADATHFVNCTGAIRYEDCTFVSMLDDAINVHGNYTPICKQIDARTLLLTFGHRQQQGVNMYEPGDKVYLINNRTMQPLATLTVRESLLLSGTMLRLEVEEELPEIQAGYVIENFTRMPELYVHNCVSGNNRPRGILCSTWRKAEITGCTFYNMSCAIHMTGDCNDWFEMGHVEDLLIADNQFKNSSYTGGPVICFDPHVLEGDAPYHKNIRIVNNTFELHDKRFLLAHHVDNLVMKDNRYIFNPDLPAHTPVGEDGFDIRCCSNITIEAPVEE